MDQGDLSDVWRGITKDSYVVDIQRVRDLETANNYVTKYASKPLNSSFSNTPTLLDEAVVALKGRRLCFCFGSWYGTSLSSACEGDVLFDKYESAGWHAVMTMEELLSGADHADPVCLDLLKSAAITDRWRMALANAPP